MNHSKPFDAWLAESSLAVSTQRDYYRAVEGRISDWAREAGLIEDNLLDISDAKEFNALRAKVEALSTYQNRNTKEKYRFSAALNRFADYLSDHAAAEPSKEFDDIRRRTDISETQKKALTNARIGQGRFRRELFRRWEACPLLKVEDPVLLVASHIKPWGVCNDVERLNPNNGLLLTSHIDAAFDAGRISFNGDGLLLISNHFREAKLLGLGGEMRISIDSGHHPFLQYHRENVYRQS